jgi:hypothetical protein
MARAMARKTTNIKRRGSKHTPRPPFDADDRKRVAGKNRDRAGRNYYTMADGSIRRGGYDED